MSLSPVKARIALTSFLIVAGLAGMNIFYFQEHAPGVASARAKAKLRADTERARRLALEPREGLTIQSLIDASAEAQIAPKLPVSSPTQPKDKVNDLVDTSRTGRFAAQPGLLDRIVPPAIASTGPSGPDASAHGSPSAEGDMRMPEIVKGVQRLLGQKGYEPGALDGIVGLGTRAAIMAYEHDNGLPVSGEPSEPLLRHLQGVPPAVAATPHSRQRPLRSPGAEHVVRSVQQSLAQLGYFSGKIDGRSTDETLRAIREFEMDQGMMPTGRISAQLITKLGRVNGSAKAAQR